MNRITSILHISDLHRSNGAEISNSALLVSLLNDRDRYTAREVPQIRTPDIIVVSGDIIRGSTSTTGSESEIQHQYNEALNFLNELTTNFLGGDKNRIVIIPGNHDVDWKFSRESMTKIDNGSIFDDNKVVKQDILRATLSQNSVTRWSWRDLSFYRINDTELYNKRLEAFSNFYETFYDGRRQYGLEAKEQFDIFDYPQYNIAITAFNSCYNNDHMRLVGDIHPDCIANANLKLRDLSKKGRLLLSTWHHNTKGSPYETHYMDSSRLKNFIDLGISLGFHGHQHKTELIHEYNDVIEQKKIIVFSAGTLCGGPRELPTGNNRQYNLIEIQEVDGEPDLKVTLHVREKTESSSFDNPIWTAGRIDSRNVSYYDTKIPRPEASASSMLMEVEMLMMDRRYPEAKSMLLNMNLSDPFVRKFLVEIILQTEDFGLALEFFSKPETEEEAIMFLNACLQAGDKKVREEAVEFVTEAFPSSILLNELVQKVKAVAR